MCSQVYNSIIDRGPFVEALEKLLRQGAILAFGQALERIAQLGDCREVFLDLLVVGCGFGIRGGQDSVALVGFDVGEQQQDIGHGRTGFYGIRCGLLNGYKMVQQRPEHLHKLVGAPFLLGDLESFGVGVVLPEFHDLNLTGDVLSHIIFDFIKLVLHICGRCIR